MTSPIRWRALAVVVFSLLGLGGCTTTSLLLSVTGVATDTSMTWEIVKHIHARMTEGDPAPCSTLDSVERALNRRCGEFRAGSIQAADIKTSKFGPCALTLAAADPRLWPVLPDLVAKGARPASCTQSPIVALAQANDCPDLSAVTADVRHTLVTLAQSDPRAVHHDSVRWLSCPASRNAGMARVLVTWLDNGALEPAELAFSPLAALHPSALGSPIADAIEARGHHTDVALGGYVGQRNASFEEALRTSDWRGLEWWLEREPQLANRVPGRQLDWLPLARVITPGYLVDPASRAEMVSFLLARGADPRTRLPSDPSQTVLSQARAARSPLLAVLDAAPSINPDRPSTLAANSRAMRLAGQ